MISPSVSIKGQIVIEMTLITSVCLLCATGFGGCGKRFIIRVKSEDSYEKQPEKLFSADVIKILRYLIIIWHIYW